MRPLCLPAWSRPTILSLAIALLALPLCVAGDQPAANPGQAKTAEANPGQANPGQANPVPANSPPANAAATAGEVDYLTQVRPILSRACYNCHGPDEGERKAGLRLDQRDAAVAPLESTARALVPGNLADSELWARITSTDPVLRMPPGDSTPLTPAQLDVVKRWIEQGARFAEHWSFVPPRRAPLPAVANPLWPRNAIDHFVAARWSAARLTGNPEADRHTLVRRLSLDLRGIPPTPAEVAQFVSDPRPEAYEELVDRFLSDPAYGERWGRMWLDLARYADSKGLGSDPLRTIWRYRDWVIDAFNANQPFDQFTVDQLAGDLLPEPALEQRVATAFHRNTLTNTEGGIDDEEYRVAAVKDRADTTLQVWMGLTIGCAKCHSHKFDPISQAEYYQFFGIFNQTADSDKGDEYPTLPAPTFETELRARELDAQLATLRQQLDTPTPELATAQAAWEASLGQAPTWHPLTPADPAQADALKTATLKAESGATLTPQPDGSILVAGTAQPHDVYTVAVDLSLAGFTGLRLETLPDASLPAQGAGRATDGNFVLSRISATVAPTADPNPRLAGRFVRIELPGSQKILSLAEVEVFADNTNIARKGQATQSSVDYNGPPELAVDGQTDGAFDKKSVTHTRTEDNPWWEVDLGETRPIDRIRVWNRTDNAVGARLAGAKVLLLDANRQPVWQHLLAAAPPVSAELSLGGPQPLPLAQASATHSQPQFPIANALTQPDLAASGWAVGPLMTQPHTAIFAASAPTGQAPQNRLTVTLEHRFKMPGYTLGRFRLSATNSPSLPRRVGVPADVLAILDQPANQRTPEQLQRVAAHYRSIAPALQPLRDQIAALAKARPEVPTVPVMVELPAAQHRKTHVMIKGNFLNLGDEVLAGLPKAFHPLARPAGADQAPVNRLELAHWLTDSRNPLTARVMANRLWSQIFGIGLVETEEDFGSQGDLPTHPELLDWLALDLARDWNVKGLLKTIVTSATYRQSSHVTPAQLEQDPRNRLLSRAPRYRLEAEMVRDQALALAGLLSRKSHGPSVYPPQPPGLWQAAFNGERTWTTSQGEDKYRRGLYTLWRRTVPYPSMAAFDAPSREICTVRRVRTNTPLQAFVTLNDPVYVEASQGLARRMAREGGATTRERVTYGLALVLARAPQPEQIEELTALYESEREAFNQDAAAAKELATNPLGPLNAEETPEDLAALTVVANILLNLDGVLTRN